RSFRGRCGRCRFLVRFRRLSRRGSDGRRAAGQECVVVLCPRDDFGGGATMLICKFKGLHVIGGSGHGGHPSCFRATPVSSVNSLRLASPIARDPHRRTRTNVSSVYAKFCLI